LLPSTSPKLQAQEDLLVSQGKRLDACKEEARTQLLQQQVEHANFKAGAEKKQKQLQTELESSHAAGEQAMQRLQKELENSIAAEAAKLEALQEELGSSKSAVEARQQQLESVMEGARQVRVGGECPVCSCNCQQGLQVKKCCVDGGVG